MLGLVGLVVAGTLPFLSATVGRTRMARHAAPLRLAAVLVLLAGALAVAAVGLGITDGRFAGAGLVGYAAGIVVVLTLLPRPALRTSKGPVGP